MKKRPPVVEPSWNELFPLLISRWRKLMKLPLGPADRLQTREFQSLIHDLLENKGSKDLSSIEAFGAYLLYNYPLRYAEGISLLKELPKKPTRVLELGALSGSFALAALQHGATEVFAVDEDERALRYGADIAGHLGYPLSIRTGNSKDLRSLGFKDKWDLIILPYYLFNYFYSRQDQIHYIQELMSMLSADGHLLIVEPSATEINREFLALRDKIAELKIPIAAPCLWKGNCPALKHGSSPCFAQRPIEKPELIKEIQRASKINLSSLKMSYLLLSASEIPALDNNLYRVVSPPVDTYKGSRFFLCGVKGKKTLGSNLKEQPKESRAYDYLKRGDVIAIDDAGELDGDLLVMEGTTLRLHSPCDKPVIKE